MAVTHWSRKDSRDIILRTDNQNVLRWAESARARAPASDRLLRALNFFCLTHLVDILPVCVRWAITISPMDYPGCLNGAWRNGLCGRIWPAPTQPHNSGAIWPCRIEQLLWRQKSPTHSRAWRMCSISCEPTIIGCANGDQSVIRMMESSGTGAPPSSVAKCWEARRTTCSCANPLMDSPSSRA